MKVYEAIERIQKELSIDKREGSYYHSWQCNIAMAIRDNVKRATHEEANVAAKAFLELLLLSNKSVEGYNYERN